MWLIIVIIAVIILIHYKYKPLLSAPMRWMSVTFVAVIATFFGFIIVINVAVNTLARPSRVDASPIALLTNEQVGRSEEVLLQLYESGYSWTYSTEEFTDHFVLTHRFGSYSGVWNREELPPFSRASLSVSITAYVEEDQAIGRMRSGRRFSRSYTEFINDNNTEIVLMHPFMPGSSDTFYFPSSERQTISFIRMENVVIRLWETRRWHDTRDYLSNHFIELLVELLQED